MVPRSLILRKNVMTFHNKTPGSVFTSQSDIFDGEVRDGAWDIDDEERLPPNVAFPLIILLSLSCWAVILTVVLWLVGIAN